MYFNKIKVENKKQLKHLYDDNALTFEGMRTNEEDLEQMHDFFTENGVEFRNDDINIFVIKGDFMNEQYGLTGDNAYPGNLNIVCIELEEFKDMKALMAVRMRYFGMFRWFNDVVDNNVARER